MTLLPTLLLAGTAGLGVANAQETVDVGVLKDEDLHVVQDLLYPKEDTTEFGGFVGVMPFDAYTTTPVLGVNVVRHNSEALGFGVTLTGGYSLKNATYKELAGPAYGVSPDAYRFLASGTADLLWSPIYAKMNLAGRSILHHDFYGVVGGGATLEQALLPDKSMAVAPTWGVGVGARIFMGERSILRIQIRDDMLLERRVKTVDTQGTFLKQNVAVTVGYGALMGG